MRTAYASELVTVIHGEALDALATIPTESVDLILTDPPYGVEYRSNRRTDLFDGIANDGADDRDGIRSVLAECIRVVGQNRHLYIFGPADALEGLKVSETASLVWDKATPGMGNTASPWAPAHEPLTFAVSKHRHGGKRGTPAAPVRLRKGSVLRFPRPTGRNVRHPSEKPTALLRELVESSSRAGDLILDPFGGVGSTAVAALLSGRRAYVCELDERYVDIAVERVKAAERLVAAAAAV